MLFIRMHDDSGVTALWALGIDVRGPYGDSSLACHCTQTPNPDEKTADLETADL